MNIEFTPKRQLRNGGGPLNSSMNYGEGTSRSLNSSLTNVNNSINGTLNGETSSQGTLTQSQSRPSVSLCEKIHFFTGTAERVLAWNRVFKERCYFEVIASVVSVQDPLDKKQTILLKDKKGPILKVVHYSNHTIEEKDFTVGQVLRCVGYMTGINAMVAVNIRKATPDEVASLKRYCYIGDFTIAGLINEEENH